MTSHNERQLTCNLCKRPINLVKNTVSDEHGNPVHEECYVDVLLANGRDRITQEILIQEPEQPSRFIGQVAHSSPVFA